MKNNTNIELSIVTTVYNDAEIVSLLVKELCHQCEQLKVSYEIILVNDYSTDSSEIEIQKECKKNENVKSILLSRNYGQQIAISAGMLYANGKYIVIMDGDLQNPPSEIPRLYNEILKGYDIVYTVSKTRNNFFNRITSSFFWYILTKLFGVKIVQNQLMMKIMNHSFVDRYNQYNEINRTVEGIIVDISENYSVLQVENQERISGKSHYNFFKRSNLMIDMLIGLTNVPLNMMLYFGWLVFLITIILSIYNLIAYLYFNVPAGFTSIILSIFLFGSLIILLLGFIGRYLSNIYNEVRRRPLFHIKATCNINVPKK
jgi:glycosyltransferase involved in cell wall biosynthesis